MSDPWAQFPDAPAAAAAPQAADPWASFPDAKQPSQQSGPNLDQGAQAAFGHGFIEGVPVLGPALTGAADYVGSHIGSWISGKPVDQVLKEGQALAKATAEAHPAAAIMGSATGTTMALNPVMAAVPEAFGLGAGALSAGKIGAGAATGAVMGAADSAIRSGGDPTSAVIGAGIGGLTGAAGPLIGAALSRSGEAIADRIAQNNAIRDINMPLDPTTGQRSLAPVQVSRPAAEVLTRAAESDGTIAGQGAANIRAAGPDAMLADAGPGSQNVLDVALQRGGPGAVDARAAIEGRAAQADQQLTAALDQSLGRPQGVQTATDALRRSTATARGDAYDAAYAAPIDYSSQAGQQLENLIRTRVPPGIIARANAQMRMDGDVSQQILARVADDGSVTYERLPDVRQIDYIKRSLQDVAQRGDGQGALGGNTSEGRSYGNLARELRDTLQSAVPEYRTALQTAAQPIQARNALEFGSEILRPSVPRDVAADTVRGMTAPELQAARQGLRSQIAETMANVKRTMTDPNIDARQAMEAVKTLTADAAQQKIGLLISQNEQRAMTQALTRAARALELRAAVAGNSRTFVRGMTDNVVKQATAPGPIGKALMGEPVKAGKSAVQFVTRMTPADITAREDRVYNELARVLTGPRGADAVGLLDRITQANNARAATNSFARRLPYAPVAQTGVLSLLPLLDKQRN